MISRILLATALLVGGATSLAATPITLAFPDSYTPGTPFSFSVSIPAVTNLGSYNIDILLSGDSGVAGTDYYFDLDTTGAAASGYVFPATDFYADATNLNSATTERLTLTDFNFIGVNVIPGVNSSIANVVVATLPGYTGGLTFSIDTDFLILDTPDVTPTSVTEFAAIQADTAASGPTILLAVPEPGTAGILVGIASAFVARRRRRAI